MSRVYHVQHGPQKRVAVQDLVLQWAAAHLRDFPWRNENRTAYEILVAEVLLKRTTATAAARVYDDFIARFASLKNIADASLDDLAQALSSIGLQRQRARSFKGLACHLIGLEAGQVPSTLPQLLRVPGIGEYSARAIMLFGHGIPAAILDANVERLLHRVYLADLVERPARHTLQGLADDLLPSTDYRNYSFALLDLGATVCRYVAPQCHECPLVQACDYYQQSSTGMVRELPGRYQTSTSTNLRMMRLANGMSLQSLASTAQVTKSTVIRIESGRSSPTDRTLAKLATALGVEVSDLTN